MLFSIMADSRAEFGCRDVVLFPFSHRLRLAVTIRVLERLYTLLAERESLA